MSIAKKLILALFCIALTPTAYAEKPKEVIVVNTPATIIANIPEVTVANVPEVHITNEAPIPVLIPEPAQTIVEWRYVGHTAYAAPGNFEFEGLLGIAGMNKACSTEFGASARAATISEALFMDSPADVEDQWLVPGASSITITYDSPNYTPFDSATGRQVGRGIQGAGPALVNAYCRQYTNDDQWGPILTRNGSIYIELCSAPRFVACSAPVAIPVTQ